MLKYYINNKCIKYILEEYLKHKNELLIVKQ